MATIEKFEDLKSWQKARELCRVIFKLTNKTDFEEDVIEYQSIPNEHINTKL